MIYCIRPLGPDDVPVVRLIEGETLSPWFPDTDRKKAGAIELVVQLPEGDLAGWCCCRMIPPEAELLKISIARSFRGEGLGSLLLKVLAELLIREGCKQLFLEVRSANEEALRLYRRCGFRQEGLRRRYYSEPTDDGVVMKCTLGRS